MSPEKLVEIKSRNLYWEEILNRDEPRKSICCKSEVESLLDSMNPVDILELIHLGAKSLIK